MVSPARLPTTPSPAVPISVLDEMRKQIEELQARTTNLGELISPTDQGQAYAGLLRVDTGTSVPRWSPLPDTSQITLPPNLYGPFGTHVWSGLQGPNPIPGNSGRGGLTALNPNTGLEGNMPYGQSGMLQSGVQPSLGGITRDGARILASYWQERWGRLNLSRGTGTSLGGG